MRIIAGERRGHKFDGPRDDATRPTSDLVRESIFNILGEAVEGRVAVDLFAGSGGLGLEALSRGAKEAIFVELDRHNVGLVKRNVGILRYEDRARVVKSDAHRWARSFAPDVDEPMVVFLDPPYREYENHPGRVRQTLEHLLGTLPDGSTIVVESRRDLDESVLPEPDAWDVRRYGGTQVAIREVESGGKIVGENPASRVEPPPTLPSPAGGEGLDISIQNTKPSPLAGEGRVGGRAETGTPEEEDHSEDTPTGPDE